MNWFTGQKSEADLEREASVQSAKDQADHDAGQKAGSEMGIIGEIWHTMGGTPETPYDKGVENGLNNKPK